MEGKLDVKINFDEREGALKISFIADTPERQGTFNIFIYADTDGEEYIIYEDDKNGTFKIVDDEDGESYYEYISMKDYSFRVPSKVFNDVKADADNITFKIHTNKKDNTLNEDYSNLFDSILKSDEDLGSIFNHDSQKAPSFEDLFSNFDNDFYEETDDDEWE